MAVVTTIVLGFLALFYVDNQEFMDTAKEQMKQGYEWEYVGPQELDSRAKSIPLQVGKDNPFVIFKLKKK